MIRGAILRTQTDERLVALARTGHQPAFEAIVERYRPELVRSLRRLLPPGSVDDALQQTHLQAWKALAGGTEVRELRAWLHRIARNAGIAVATRGYDYDELQDALLVTPGPEDDLERREAVRRALRGIAALPERQRTALLAVAIGGRSHAEVALDLGITDTAARQLLHRARVALLAAASFATPPQLVHWAAGAGHATLVVQAAVSSSKVAGTGLGGSLAASATKMGAIAVTVGGVAAGIGPLHRSLVPTPSRTPAVAHHQRVVSVGRQAHPAQARVRLVAAASRPAPTLRAPTPAHPRPAPTRRSVHRVRSVSSVAIGKVAPPVVAPPMPTPTPTPGAVSAPTPTAVPTPAPPSMLAILAAWWYAHRTVPSSALAALARGRSEDGATPAADAGTAPTSCRSPGLASATERATVSSAGPSSDACAAPDHSNNRRSF